MDAFEHKAWFEFLEHGQKDLVIEAQALYEREIKIKDVVFHDYSFVVFPMAKAYEGFLKKLLFTLDMISEQVYMGDHFRIGKSLNPDLPERYRNHDWVVGDLDLQCGLVGMGRFHNQKLSTVLWRCWKRGRNLLFHYFPQHENFISLEEAGVRIEELADAMAAAVECVRDLKLD